MDPVGVSAYLLSVASQASARADAAERATTIGEVARLQAAHERQLAAMAGLLSAWVAQAAPARPPPLRLRLRLAWAVLWGSQL